MKTSITIDRNNGIKVGDIITAYHKGYHVVVNIIPRIKECDTSLIQYKTVLNSNFKKVEDKFIQQCDAYYCRTLTKEKILSEKANKIETIKNGFDFLLTFATK